MFPTSSFGKLIFGRYAEGCVIYNANVVTEDNEKECCLK